MSYVATAMQDRDFNANLSKKGFADIKTSGITDKDVADVDTHIKNTHKYYWNK